MLFYKLCRTPNFKLLCSPSSRMLGNKNSMQLQKHLLLLHHPFYQPTCSLSWTSSIIALSHSTPVLTFQEYLIYVHDYTGLPWWMMIMLTTFSIRFCIVFPLAVHQHQVIARFEKVNQELLKLAPELNKEVAIAAKMFNWDKQFARRVFKRNMSDFYQKFVVRDNCHPFKSVILIIFQVPLWICFSMALRNITFQNYLSFSDAELILSQLTTEGVLWFTNLTLTDRIFIPLLLGAVNFLLIEIHALRNVGKGSLLQKIILNIMRCFTIILSAVATINPTSMTFYWLCSSTFGICQNMLLMTPAVRRKLNIPTPKESISPFQTIADKLRGKLKK